MAGAPAIGIDLGTCSSSVAVFQNGKVEVLASHDHGNRATPSVVAFISSESAAGRLVGDDAKNQMTMNPANTIYGTQRLIGRKFEDSSVQKDMKHWAFEVINDGGGKPKVSAGNKGEGNKKSWFPEEISSMILAKLKETAEKHLGQRVTDAVVTAPAYFNAAQRQAIRDAGTIAGLNVLRILSGSTAAALAYGFDRMPKSKRERHVLVFDLGGGTTSVSILTIEDGIVEVKSTAGDAHLGGEDFDNRMVTHFIREFERRFIREFGGRQRPLARLRIVCEEAKRALSSASVAAIQIDSLFDGIDFRASITRARFEELNDDLFRRTLEPVKKALRDAKMDKTEIHDILLVGGSSRVPRIQHLLQEFFNGKELNKSVHPDEAMAVGAALQAAIINGDIIKSTKLKELEFVPLSVGIETFGGAMTTMLARNTILPASQTRLFNRRISSKEEPVRDRLLLSNSFKVKVYEGEHAVAKDNRLLGELDIRDIIPNPPGIPEIDVTLALDRMSNLEVSALEKSTGKLAQTTIIICDQSRVVEIEGAKNRLKHTCVIMKSVLEDDGRPALEACNEVLRWLNDDNHELAEQEEFEDKEKGLERIRKSLIRKLQGGGGGGGEGAGFSGAKRSRII